MEFMNLFLETLGSVSPEVFILRGMIPLTRDIVKLNLGLIEGLFWLHMPVYSLAEIIDPDSY